MIDNLAIIVDELDTESKAALLRAAQYLAALPGTEYDIDRIRRASEYCGFPLVADAPITSRQTHVSVPCRQG